MIPQKMWITDWFVMLHYQDFSLRFIDMRTQKILLGLGFLSALTVGCAEEATREPDRLTKMHRQTEHNEMVHQQNQFRQIVKDQRIEQRAKINKQFPMPKILTEETLYTEIIRAYQMRQIDAVSHYTGEFLQRYPNSVFADSALYLRGELSLIMGFTAEALRDFEQVVDDYPAGKKYVAALYGKAVCYRKLQLYNYAEQALNDVNKSFPGSPESVRVPLEQRLLQAERSPNGH